MSEEKERKDEAFAVGRILGVIAKKRPEVYEKIKRYMEVTGTKSTDLLLDALDVYSDYIDFAEISPKCIIVAQRFFERVAEWVVVTTANIMKLMANVTYQPVEEEGEEEKKEKLASREIRMKMIESFMPILMNVLTSLLSTVSSTISKQSMQMPALQQPTQPRTPVKIVAGKGEKRQEEEKKKENT